MRVLFKIAFSKTHYSNSIKTYKMNVVLCTISSKIFIYYYLMCNCQYINSCEIWIKGINDKKQSFQ